MKLKITALFHSNYNGWTVKIHNAKEEGLSNDEHRDLTHKLEDALPDTSFPWVDSQGGYSGGEFEDDEENELEEVIDNIVGDYCDVTFEFDNLSS